MGETSTYEEQTTGPDGKWIKLKTPDYDPAKDGAQYSYLRLGKADPSDSIESLDEVSDALGRLWGAAPGEVTDGTFLFTHGDFQNVVSGSHTEAVSYGSSLEWSYRDANSGFQYFGAINAGSVATVASVLDSTHYLGAFKYSYSAVPVTVDISLGKVVSVSTGYAYSYARSDSTAVAYSDTTSVFTTFEVRVVDPPNKTKDNLKFASWFVTPAAFTAGRYINQLAKSHAQSRIFLDRSVFLVDLEADPNVDLDRVAFSASVPGPGAAITEHVPGAPSVEIPTPPEQSMIGIGYDVSERKTQPFRVVIHGTSLELKADEFIGCPALAEWIRKEVLGKKHDLEHVTQPADAAKQQVEAKKKQAEQKVEDAKILQSNVRRESEARAFAGASSEE